MVPEEWKKVDGWLQWPNITQPTRGQIISKVILIYWEFVIIIVKADYYEIFELQAFKQYLVGNFQPFKSICHSGHRRLESVLFSALHLLSWDKSKSER